MKKLLWLVLVLFLLAPAHWITAQSDLPSLPDIYPKIDRQPAPSIWSRGALDALPTYNPASDEIWQVDVRSADLTKLDLTHSLDDLLHASFDSGTQWPPAEKLPPEFDPQQIMELGKNPGLGIRQLHERGITGLGVGIAIIDQTLLVDHQEYKDQLRLYEETDDIQGGWLTTQLHGPAVASIAVGNTVGVAPDADLYYIGTTMCYDEAAQALDFACLAASVRRILEVNQGLPEGRKIRVLSMSIGWGPDSKGYDDIVAATNEAKAAGLLVICSSTEEVHGFKFNGLGRSPLADPDSATAYEPGSWWSRPFYIGSSRLRTTDFLLVPMDSRAVAAPGGTDQYVFYREGGWSWSIPYIAGVYALAAQVKPDITPDQFWASALETGQTIDLQYSGAAIPFGKILDSVALIAALETQ